MTVALAVSSCDREAEVLPKPGLPIEDQPLDLPPGFRQRVISRAGEQTPEGAQVAGRHDGMAALRHSKGTLLVRNHELLPDHEFPLRGRKPFQADDVGGVSAVLVSPERQTLSELTLLSGTRRNCAGGQTPWGTWLSCEEFRDDEHGFVFEVVPEEENDLSARPIRAMGHFRHEAVGVDPATGIVYLTEDQPPRSFAYRFIPNNRASRVGALHDGGTLQAMRLEDGAPAPSEVGGSVQVQWIDVDPDEAPERAEAAGAHAFRKLEGALFSEGVFWFPDTDGGPSGLGEIFRYSPGDETLELFFQPDGAAEMQKPDNLTMTPWGDLWFVEDGQGVDRVMGVTSAGSAYHFATNRLSDSELSGPCFSPDGRTFFVNVYDPGLTIAVWGPFEAWLRGLT